MWAGCSKFKVFDEFIRIIISTYYPYLQPNWCVCENRVLLIAKNYRQVILKRQNLFTIAKAWGVSREFLPKLSGFVAAIIVQVDQVSGGDKPHPYLFGALYL